MPGKNDGYSQEQADQDLDQLDRDQQAGDELRGDPNGSGKV